MTTNPLENISAVEEYSLRYLLDFVRIYQDLLHTTYLAVGFIDGGFCPEPCEHTTLQFTNPELYQKIMNIYKVHLQADGVLKEFREALSQLT